MWLHGSCAAVTEGLCGNWNANGNDDIEGGIGNINVFGENWKIFDDTCPPPPPPYDPCRDIGNLHDQAEAICSPLTGKQRG